MKLHNLSAADQNTFLNYLCYNSYRSERYKLFYVATPKVACTTLKWWFAALEGQAQVLQTIVDSSEPDPALVIHDTFHKIAPNVTGLTPEALLDTLASDDYFRFAVVRNPFKRIFSAWQSKLLLREPQHIGPYSRFDFFHHSIESIDDIAAAFEGFLEHLVNNETPTFWNVHWCPQVSLLRPDIVNYSKLVKIEDVGELNRALSERLGQHDVNPFSNRHANESILPFLPEFFTERSIQLIRLLYAEDFHKFGYEEMLPESMETISHDQFNFVLKSIKLIQGRHRRFGERNEQVIFLTRTLSECNVQISCLNQKIGEQTNEAQSYREQHDKFKLQSNVLQNALIEAQTLNANLSEGMAERGEEIARLNQIVVDQSDELQAYRIQAAEFVRQVNAVQNELIAAQTQISNLNQAITERNEQIIGLNQVVVERSNELQAYRIQAEEFVRQVNAIQNELIAAQRQISNLNQVIFERNEEIVGLNKAVAEQANGAQVFRARTDEFSHKILTFQGEIIANQMQTFNLNQLIAERDAQILSLIQLKDQLINEIEISRTRSDELLQQEMSLGEELLRAQTHNHMLNQVISERDGQIEVLKQSISDFHVEDAHLRKHLKELLISRSWKITRPLRLMGLIVRRLPLASLVDSPKYLVDGKSQTSLIYDHSVSTSPAYSIAPERIVEGFDEDFYLRMYPDIKNADVNPEEHFFQIGLMEGRLGCAPALDLVGSFDEFNFDRETVLVVSHEASLTGAPVLSFNIVRELVSKYNVIALVLRGGAIEEAFHNAGAVVVKAYTVRNNPIVADLIIDSLCKQASIKFALVNSIESRFVLAALAKHYVPTISLIHEFAAYTRPKEAFREAVFWSGASVFSTKITLESALHELPDLAGRISHVLPQGRCQIPSMNADVERLAVDRATILEAFRPYGESDDAIVVLGAGFVQLRKGVDIFIECAARVVRSKCKRQFRFIWLGSGFDPEFDVSYSVYLSDQIKRAGLEDIVQFLDETLAIELAYEKADMLLLSSRLDPLPNVAIDAMTHGLPVLCFEDTTGIAEILTEGDLAQTCVAKYLDTDDMAIKIISMAESEVLRKEVGRRSQVLALSRFNMHTYVEALEKLANEVSVLAKQEKEDAKVVESSSQFKAEFVCLPNSHSQSERETIRVYIRSWQTGIGRRKPFPGFHPGVYAEKHGVVNADAFADYLNAGSPAGVWLQQVITNHHELSQLKPDNLRVALHLHIYYPALFSDMLERIKLNNVRPDLFISVPNEKVYQIVCDALLDYTGEVVSVQVVPNKGRDIGPFLTAFGHEIAKNYDIVGHLHTKVSADVKEASVGKNWYQFLLENLLGGQAGGVMADSILAAMRDDPSIGLVFADDPNVVGWGDNKSFAETLAKRLSIEKLTEHFNFPVGTMFWARVSALRPLIDLDWDWGDYPSEPLPYDGTILHAIERILPFLVTERQLRSVVTNIPGIKR